MYNFVARVTRGKYYHRSLGDHLYGCRNLYLGLIFFGHWNSNFFLNIRYNIQSAYLAAYKNDVGIFYTVLKYSINALNLTLLVKSTYLPIPLFTSQFLIKQPQTHKNT